MYSTVYMKDAECSLVDNLIAEHASPTPQFLVRGDPTVGKLLDRHVQEIEGWG